MNIGCTLRLQQPIGRDLHFGYKAVILGQNEERIFILPRRGTAQLVSRTRHLQSIEEHFHSIVQITPTPYQVSRGVPTKEKNIETTVRCLLAVHERDEVKPELVIACFGCVGVDVSSKKRKLVPRFSQLGMKRFADSVLFRSSGVTTPIERGVNLHTIDGVPRSL